MAQCLVILSIGMSLGCVSMGFNGEVDDQLSQLRHVSTFKYVVQPYFISHIHFNHYERVDKAVENTVGRALDEHYMMLLLSIVCFYLSVLGFTVYSIYSSVGQDYLTVRYVFFAVATSGLLVVVGFVLRWNQRFRT